MEKYCLVQPKTVITTVGPRPFDNEAALILVEREIATCMSKGIVYEILKSGNLKGLTFQNYKDITEETVTDFSKLPAINLSTIPTVKEIKEITGNVNTTVFVEAAPVILTTATLGIQEEIVQVEPEPVEEVVPETTEEVQETVETPVEEAVPETPVEEVATEPETTEEVKEEVVEEVVVDAPKLSGNNNNRRNK